MAALKVKRQTLDGTSEAFEFDVKGVKFLVKNLSDNDCLVNFDILLLIHRLYTPS